MMLFVKGARGLSKSTNVFDSILLSLVLVDHFKYSISCERFRASTVLLMQCTCNFGEKFRFTEVVLFQNFLLTRITTRKAYYHNKKGKCRVKKSKTTLLLEIWSLHQRRAC